MLFRPLPQPLWGSYGERFKNLTARRFRSLLFGKKTLKQFYNDVAADLKQAPQQASTPNFVPLPVGTAQALIDNYVSPLWFAKYKEGDEVGKTHAHNLANYLRRAAGIPEQ
ncbi:hypothetical protein [Paenibacillus sp. DMB20]|uniref:hypothetical protein n=1 Tax=Paenibacillus sp. DMB20 TaxID=1642570 RepID=UPI000627B162|nr:hypothetical protein [Paenibacillus sp. DMB20]KKO52210.1 hypothetical protein XI25_22655 [Paenibacillus sp. DMB20]